MAEGRARFSQYDYKANSNLVLQSSKRGRIEKSVDAESLAGRMGDAKMGDRVQRKKPQELLDREKRKKEKASKKKKKLGGGGGPIGGYGATDVLSATNNMDTALYQPKTPETRQAFEVLLKYITSAIGDQPADILHGAADEVLAHLKDDGVKDRDRRLGLEDILNKMSDDTFTRFVNVAKRITDYHPSQDNEDGDNEMDEQFGVAVVIDDDSSESSLADDIADDMSEMSNEDGVDTGMASKLEAADGDGSDGEDGQESSKLDPRSIDGFWIQREIGHYYEDPLTAQKMAKDVIAAMSENSSDRECENKLVLLLDYDKFDLVKRLLGNRLVIVWCTRRAQAQSDEERGKIDAEMRAEPHLAAILSAILDEGNVQTKNKDFERSLRKEARSLSKRGAGKSKGDKGGDAMDIDFSMGASTAGRNIVNLEDLSFQQGGRLMSNEKCELPPGSYRTSEKGYEEVHVPGISAEVPKGEKLVPIGDMPEWSHKAFKGMKSLNRVQSKLYETAMFKEDNILLCAPTGAGKTNVAMMTILNQIGLHRDPNTGVIDLDKFKIVYVAPMKSLVQEMVGNFQSRLKDYGIKVHELSGDMTMTKQQIMETQIIVTTPEKWDIITRKSGDRTYTQLVKLLIIDEIHLLHDERGPVLESLVARTIRQVEQTQEHVRLVGLSATCPNYQDVALLLRIRKGNGLFYFDNGYRPCPLEQTYIGITAKKPLKRFQLMNEVTYKKVIETAVKNQALVFVHSRKETAKTAQFLKESALENEALDLFLKEPASREILKMEVEREEDGIQSDELRELLPFGIGIHHAGMSRRDRALVEDLFVDGHLQVLVSTATLAWGVNLPAHTVIIKGTQIYNPEKGAWVELSFLDVMQMMGRAGRPQYDASGHGIIITSHPELQYYLSLLNQQLPIESQMMSKLADQLNAEIVLGTVSNMEEAVNWLGYTYLYVRMLKNPSLYGINGDMLKADPDLEARRADLIHSAAVQLDKTNLIKYDKKGGNFQVTDLGRVSSHYYVTHYTMSVFNDHLKPTLGDIELFRLFSLAGEFRNMHVRQEEKGELQKLVEQVPIPVKEAISEPTAKVNILLQAYISRLRLEGLAICSDMVFIHQSAARLLRALFEIVVKRGWAALAEKCLAMCKMVDHRIWGSMSPLRQFKNVPMDAVKRLERKDFTFERLYDLKAQEIGELIRVPKAGKTIYKYIHQFPRLELDAHVQPITRTVLRVDLTLTPDFHFDEKVHGNAEPFYIFVQDVDGETILHHEYFVLKRKFAEEEHTISFTVPIYEPLPPQYFITVHSDRWLGSETTLPISFRHLILPEKYPPHTELLDLQPIPVSSLENKAFEALLPFKVFNPVQTQVFGAVYQSDANVLIAAPTSSGKTACAELAIFQAFNAETPGRVIYIAPLASLVRERYADWKPKFETLGKKVTMLTGEMSADLKLLAEGDIVVATPEQWDVLSRRWKQRKNCQNISLFIVDELHLIGGEAGPVLEVVTSRTRYVAEQLERKIRIVALSASLANAVDLAKWVGAEKHTFNFLPNVRPVPLELGIQGFDIAHAQSRLLAMSKVVYSNIVNRGKDQPCVVFVPSRKRTRVTAIEMLTYCAADDNPKRFLHANINDIKPMLDRVRDQALQQALEFGVAYYHEGLPESDREIVHKLFTSGAVQILVATHSLSWGMNVPAHLVVIMDTQYYDGKEHRYSDYPITEVLQMMGRAGRPLIDTTGRCVILTHSSKKEYYKKFLYEPLPVESHLDHVLADHINAEVVTKTIESKQDAVDYLTWTFFYRRLRQNPNYYNLQGVTNRHLSDHLSELVENTVDVLEQSKCISVEDELMLSPLNLGMIAAYYYNKYTTIEVFNASLTATTKLRGIVEILSAASEFDQVPIRHKEEYALEQLARHLPLKIDHPRYTDPHTKTNILLQSHFSRKPLSADLRADQMQVVTQATRLLQAIVDVISSSGWLTPALAAMELSQMIVQGQWDKDSVLAQIPHFDLERVKMCEKAEIESVFDILELEDEDRDTVLKGLTKRQMADVAHFCNRYPNVDLSYEVEDEDDLHAGSSVVVTVQLERESDDEKIGPVNAPRYPGAKSEGWWLIVADAKKKTLLSIKRVALQHQRADKLDFIPPTQGKHTFTLYLMCDSYLGCDQEYELDLNIGEPLEEGSSDEESSSDES